MTQEGNIMIFRKTRIVASDNPKLVKDAIIKNSYYFLFVHKVSILFIVQ